MNASPQQVKLWDIVASESAESAKVGLGRHHHVASFLFKALLAKPTGSATGRQQSDLD